MQEKQLQIAHIILDEKFIDIAINNYNSIPNIKNEYLCLSSNKELRFISQKEKVELFSSQIEIIDCILSNHIPVVVLHSAFMSFRQLNRLQSDTIVIWHTWGYDIFEPSFLPSIIKNPIQLRIYKPLTLHFLNSRKQLSKYVYIELRRFLNGETYNRFKFYRRVNFISTVTNYEFELLHKNPIFAHVKKFSFKYFDSKYTVDANIAFSNGNDILISHSSDETNNHLDVLQQLERIPISDKSKIIMPMSYGGFTRGYKSLVKKYVSRSKYASQFCVLDTFMERSQYASLISDCSYAIMGNVRQQAMGNIYMLLLQGCKVFLFKESISYIELKNNGFQIFSIESMDSNSLMEPLAQDDQIRNHKLALNFLDFQEFLTEFRISIESVRSEVEKINK